MAKAKKAKAKPTAKAKAKAKPAMKAKAKAKPAKAKAKPAMKAKAKPATKAKAKAKPAAKAKPERMPKAATFDRTLPGALAAANSLAYDYDKGVDFEAYDQFQEPAENQSWIRAWTGNQELDGAEYRVFGQDGTGGYAAFWLVNEGRALVEQPIVFFGSEGELGVVARNLDDYLWILAGGVGPYEAMSYPESEGTPNEEFVALATEHAPNARKPATELIRLASEAFPKFEETIRALCRH